MIRHAWTVVSQQAFVDRDTNKLALVVAEGLTATVPIPAPPPGETIAMGVTLEIMTLWWRTAGDESGNEHESRVLIRLGETVLATLSVPLNFQGNNRLRQRVRFDSMPAQTSGVYTFCVELRNGDGWSQVAEIPFEVILQFEDHPPPSGA